MQSQSRSRSKTVPDKSVIDFHLTGIPIPACGSCPGSSRISQSDTDFTAKIDQRFSFSNRIAIEKRFQEHQNLRNGPSGSDFHVKIDQRFSFQIRSAIFICKSDPVFQNVIAITIAIEKPIRINQTLKKALWGYSMMRTPTTRSFPPSR